MTPQERQQQAVELRKVGQTYKEIAQTTGYSVDWCKKNLATVDKNSAEKHTIKEAIKLAQSNDGITGWQIEKLVRDVYPQQSEQADKAYIDFINKAKVRFKTAINKEDNTVIRPYWMVPENGHTSLHLMLECVNSVQDSIDSCVTYMRQQLDLNDSHTRSIRFAVIKLLLDSNLAPEGVETCCDRLSTIAYKLDNPNDRVYCPPTLMHTVEDYTVKCALNKPRSEKCISAEMHNDDLDIEYINSLIEEAYETN